MTAPDPQTAAEYREAQQREYGTYVAAVPIDINGVRAFNVGDPVPVSHVEGGVVSQSEVESAGGGGESAPEPAPAEEPAAPVAEPAAPRARSARAAAEEATTPAETPKG